MYGYGSVWEDERSYAQRACAEHTQVDTRAGLWTVRALFDHRRSHPCEWSDDAIYILMCMYIVDVKLSDCNTNGFTVWMRMRV
mgnify:CR=1 FL=1